VKADRFSFYRDVRFPLLLHAPRQIGKTTCLLARMDDLNRESRFTDGDPVRSNV
jgi:hypothetical protein